jgi:histidinol-phosphate phosphatase family protein
MKKAFVLFDRDGTLIDHVHHLTEVNQVKFKPDLVESLRKLKNAGFSFGIISNQSVIGRKLGNISQVNQINLKIVEFLKPHGVTFDFIYYCPHSPQEECKCRKPEIGLGLRALKEFHLDPTQSFMIGDQESDMIFGRNLGFSTIQVHSKAKKSPFSDYYSDTLESATIWILNQKSRES